MSNEKYVAYVGSYTHEGSNGIHIYDMDVKKGRIYERKEAVIGNPSYITFSSDKEYLYSICDEGVGTFKILPGGDLELLSKTSINGMRGCHISLNKANTSLFVSGYHDGKVTVLRINPDHTAGMITDEVYHNGMGSIAERNFRPHVSWTQLTPDEKLLCVCDKGIDQIKLYRFDEQQGKLKLYDAIRSQLESAPREILFCNDGRYAYVACELKNYINVYSYQDEVKNSFEFVQNIFTVRQNHNANCAVVNLTFSPDGNYLVCANAGDNSITMYHVNKETGELQFIRSLPISGDYPKYIQFFPDGKHILSMNHNANTITYFTIHPDKGLIIRNGPELKISKPNNMIIKKI